MSPLTFNVFVPGDPAPKGSMTPMRSGGKCQCVEGRDAAQRARLAAWEGAIRLAVREWFEHNNLDEHPWSRYVPLAAEVTFYRPPVNAPKDPDFPVVPPDLDKLTRSVGDSLQRSAKKALADSGLIVDDAQIVHWNCTKVYARTKHSIGARIVVWAITDEERTCLAS